jgi:hypothetical protein
MNRSLRIALGSAALVAGLAVAGTSPAAAQVSFSGSFPLPHGRISIGVGDPYFSVGSYVPYGYTVIEDPTYGYGFYYQSRWIPVRPYGSTWVITSQPYFRPGFVARPYAGYGYGYARPYSRYGYVRPYSYGHTDSRRYDSRRYDDRRSNSGAARRGTERDRDSRR